MEALYEPLIPVVINSNQMMCLICCLKADLVSLDFCGHQFCTDCLSKHLETKIRDGIVMRLEYPHCGTEISQENIRCLTVMVLMSPVTPTGTSLLIFVEIIIAMDAVSLGTKDLAKIRLTFGSNFGKKT